MTQPTFNAYGAVDLSALAQRSSRAPGGPPAPGPAAAARAGTTHPGESSPASAAGVVIDVTEANFQAEVLERSLTVPVVVDFWAEWCEPCKHLSPALERLAAEYAGRFVLARIDVEANKQIAAAAQVQSIPMVLGVVKGQAVPLFTGALPEAQVRQFIDELLRVAVANGVGGRVDAVGAAAAGEPAPAGPPHDPRYDEAYDAIERGDLDAAAAAYRALLADSPGDEDARAGLAQVQIMMRAREIDPRAVLAAAAKDPGDVDAAAAAADVELLGGHVEQALDRLVEAVRRSSGSDRERARDRLLELFTVIGADDPRVGRARVALANALF